MSSIFESVKRMIARARAEHGRSLCRLSGLVFEDEDYGVVLSEVAAKYHPEEPAAFVARHSAWLDINTANGVTRIYRKGAFAGLLFQLAGPNPPGPKLPEAG